MSKIALSPDANGAGIFTIASPNSGTNRTLTLPDNTGTLVSTGSSGGVSQTMLASGVAGTGPAFSAYLGSNQAVSSNTWTKVQINTKEFDTASCFDTSNYRFTPNVAGYYWFNAMTDNATGTPTRISHAVYKNGSVAKYGLDLGISTGNFGGAAGGVVGALIYMNGTTDYVELYINYVGGASIAGGASNQSYFQGYLVRAA